MAEGTPFLTGQLCYETVTISRYSLLTIIITNNNIYAQFSLSARVRRRTELRDGLGAPAAEHADPAFFTGQRTKLRLEF